MAPLIEATAKKLIEKTATSATFEGGFDQEWCIGTVPNGGYSLGVVNVCVHDFLANQVKSPHKDLFHISSTYLNPTDTNQNWFVLIKVTKQGKGFTNLDAVLSQKSHKTGELSVRLQTGLIFTDFGRLQSDTSTEHLTMRPESSYYSHLPTKSEPKECTRNIFENSPKINFWRRLAVYRDSKAERAFREKSQLRSIAYLDFTEDRVSKEEVPHFNNAAIILLPDVTDINIALLSSTKTRASDFWHPTMFLSIEMKRALPSFPLYRTTSVTRIRHVDHGQFEKDVEIWSHPDDAERLQLPSGVKSVILCISRQVALTIPISIQASITDKHKVAKL